MKGKKLSSRTDLPKQKSAFNEDEKHLQARLFHVLLILITPISTLGIMIPLLINSELTPNRNVLLAALVSFVFLTVIYFFGRLIDYRISAILATLIGSLAIFIIAYINPPASKLLSLYYLIIIILASSVFLSLKAAVLLTTISLIALFLTPQFIPNISLIDVIIGPFNLVMTAAVVNLLVAYYRNKLAKIRQHELAKLMHSSEKRAEQLALLNETLLDVISHRDLNELLEAITHRAAKLLGTSGSSIYLVDDSNEFLQLTAVYGPGRDLLNSKLQRGKGMAGRIMETGKPLIVPNYDTYEGRSNSIPKNLLGSIIQVPIISTDKIIGVISCQENAGTKHIFDDNDVQMLQSLAQQSALALQNAYLFKEEKTARDHAERLQAATQALSNSLVLKEVLDSILEELQKVVPYDSASVQQIKDKSHLEIIGGHGFTHVGKLVGIRFDLNAGNNPNRDVIKTRGPIILADVPKLYERYNAPPFNETLIHSWLGVPLLFGAQIIGMLALDKKEVDFYTGEHARLASAFAAQAAVAIENARLYEKTHQHAHELETLAQISASLRTIKSVSEMMPVLLEKTVEAIGAYFGVVFLVDQETNELVSRFSAPSDFYQPGLRQPMGQGITGHVATTREFYISTDIVNDPLLSLVPGEAESFAGTVSAISLPLQTPDHLVGVLHIGSNFKRQFTEADVKLLTAVSNIAANALNRATITDTLEERVRERTQALASANARLQDLDKLKTKFISDISHELRTPVATLNLYMDLLDRGKEENKAKYMTVLRQKTDLLVRLTEDILNISRLNLYEGALRFTAVNLNDTVAIVIAMNRERAQATNLDLEFIPAPNLPPINAERNQLLQAINNVLTNALDFTLEGSVTVRTLLSPSGAACLEIKDTGIGIPADEQPHIFERFYRGQNIAQLNIPGTGLGLTIVREILNLHKGSIDIESQPGEGTTVRLYWSLAETSTRKKRTLHRD